MAEENAREAAERTLQELERDELSLMIQRGVKFHVSRKVYKRGRGLLGYFQRHPETVTETFVIQEPTLNTLDRLTEIWVDMPLPEAELTSPGTAIGAAKRVARENTRRMARIVAIAVLGEDYYYTTQEANGRIRQRTDDKELDRLTDLFAHSIKPSDLRGLSQTVTNIANLADFIASMRYMSGAKTTQPIADRIE